MINTTEDFEEFLSYTAVPNKAILFNKKNETSILFRGIASLYRERIDFAEVRAKNEATKSLIEKYKIKKFPSLLVL